MVTDSLSTKTRKGNGLFTALSIIAICFAPSNSFAQTIYKFTYGGNGTRFGGTINVDYFIESEDKRQRLDAGSNEIDLGNYSGQVKLLIQVSDLQLGYNKSFTKLKYHDHPKVFYIELTSLFPEGNRLMVPFATESVRVSSETGHYGAKTDHIAYIIDSVDIKSKLSFGLKTRIVDGIYDRNWEGITISKDIVLIPKINLDSTNIAHKISANRKRSNFRQKKSEEDKVDSLSMTETIADKLWAKIEQDLISDDKEGLLERCRLYRINCRQQVFTKCKNMEDALFFMIKLVGDQEKVALVDEYQQLFPSGKYIIQIEDLLTKPAALKIPIQPGQAKLDFDQRILLVNRVQGGHLPYYIGFYDYKINKEHAVKRIRFSKENLHLDLQSLEIPEGSYSVKVMDASGQLFLEQNDVFVQQASSVPKSFKLGLLLFVMVSLYSLYKRYIHF